MCFFQKCQSTSVKKASLIRGKKEIEGCCCDMLDRGLTGRGNFFKIFRFAPPPPVVSYARGRKAVIGTTYACTVGLHGHRCTGPTICKSGPACTLQNSWRDQCLTFKTNFEHNVNLIFSEHLTPLRLKVQNQIMIDKIYLQTFSG